MEKLQPVLKQLFWICFGLLILLAPLGWWSAQGELSEQIETREAAVAKAFSDAGKNVSNVPNDRWTQQATKQNEDHISAYDRAGERLREDQLEARVYPQSISDELNRLRFGAMIDDQALRGRFGDLYRSYFYEQLQVIKPFEKGQGLVDVSEAMITQEDETQWARNVPTSTEIWNAQEDIWLLRSIYDSIAMVNEGADRIDKAPLRALLLLQLRGGDPDTEPSSGGGGGFSGSGGGDLESGFSGGTGGFGSAGMGMAGAAQSGAWQRFVGSVSSDLLNEEFGSVGGGGGSGGMSFSSSMSTDGGSYESGEESSATDTKRYVHDEEAMPYRTRAFMLKVKILQQNIPNLLAELTNSKFPVEIVRVDAEFGNDPELTESGGAGQYSSAGSGGYESGGGAGGYEKGMGGSMSSGMSGGMDMMGGGTAKGGGGLFGPYGPSGTPPWARIPLTAAEKKSIQDGKGVFADAMNNADLSIVRVAGLMTMYRSKAENEAEAEAEAAAEEESQATSTSDGSAPEAPKESNPDGSPVTEDGKAEPGDNTAADSEEKTTTEDAGSKPDSDKVDAADPATDSGKSAAPADSDNLPTTEGRPAASATDGSPDPSGAAGTSTDGSG